jgi:hypothetical protein
MKKTLFLLITLLTSQLAFSQQFVPNYDESKVPDFVLPNPLLTFKGKKVKNAKDWEKKRRPELLEFFTQNMFGEIPGDLKISSFEVVEEGDA